MAANIPYLQAPLNAEMATDEVTDQIALIEMYRQETQKESGLAAACNEALRKLQELLEREQQALQQNGPNGEHTANIEAVTRQIQRTRNFANGAGQGNSRRAHSQQQRPPRQGDPGNPTRNKNRKTMGRRGVR